MKKTIKVRNTKTVAAVLSAVLLLGLCGPAAGATAITPEPALGRPQGGEFAGEGDVLTPPDVRPACPPPLTEEQENLLERARWLVGELKEILRQASAYAARESWMQVQIELLDYVSTMVTLEKTLGAFVATVEEGRPFPLRRYLGPILQEVASQAGDVADVWEVLPEANREPVKRAVEAAAEASDHPRFWRHLVRIVLRQVEPDPGARRERIERALERARESLERALARIEKIERHIATLEEKIEECEDEAKREKLLDLKHLAELDLAVCEARVERDKFAIRMFTEWLEELDG